MLDTVLHFCCTCHDKLMIKMGWIEGNRCVEPQQAYDCRRSADHEGHSALPAPLHDHDSIALSDVTVADMM